MACWAARYLLTLCSCFPILHCALRLDTLNSVSGQNLLKAEMATSAVPQSCPPACVCSASAVSCFPPSFLCDGILPGGENSSLLWGPHIHQLKEGHALKYWQLLISLLFHFYMENTITCKVFTAFLLHLKIFFLIWNIGNMEEVQLQPEIQTSF